MVLTQRWGNPHNQQGNIQNWKCAHGGRNSGSLGGSHGLCRDPRLAGAFFPKAFSVVEGFLEDFSPGTPDARAMGNLEEPRPSTSQS